MNKTKNTTNLVRGTFDKDRLIISTIEGDYGISYDSTVRPEYIFNGQAVEGVIRNSSFLVAKKIYK